MKIKKIICFYSVNNISANKPLLETTTLSKKLMNTISERRKKLISNI